MPAKKRTRAEVEASETDPSSNPEPRARKKRGPYRPRPKKGEPEPDWSEVRRKQARGERTSRACDRCKAKRISCDDNQDGCNRCKTAGVECKFTDSRTKTTYVRKDTHDPGLLQNQVRELQQRVSDLENENKLLRAEVERCRAMLPTVPAATTTFNNPAAPISAAAAAAAAAGGTTALQTPLNPIPIPNNINDIILGTSNPYKAPPPNLRPSSVLGPSDPRTFPLWAQPMPELTIKQNYDENVDQDQNPVEGWDEDEVGHTPAVSAASASVDGDDADGDREPAQSAAAAAAADDDEEDEDEDEDEDDYPSISGDVLFGDVNWHS